LIVDIVSHHPGPKTKEWKDDVKKEYIAKHSVLKPNLSYINLAPKFPPRFRIKKPTVSAMIARHFGYELEQLPGMYSAVSDIDKKCIELERLYKNKTVSELADMFGINKTSINGNVNKGITEQIVIAMFGGNSKKLNQVELFQRFGLIAKSIVLTHLGGRTEDMKLFRIDFNEMTRTEIEDEDGIIRTVQFDDSELYTYFNDHEFLCIIFQEPEKEFIIDSETGKRIKINHSLMLNRFVGFKRLVFSDDFINSIVKRTWDDTREKIFSNELVDVQQRYKDGSLRYLSNGEISSAPNFIKSFENDIFIRGGGINSAAQNKTECVNGIKMLPQYIWIKGSAIVNELEK